MTRNTLQAKIRFGHYLSHGDEQCSYLRIEDTASSRQVVEVEFTARQLADFIRGQEVAAEVEWSVDRLGWKYENKTETVPLDLEKCKAEWKDGNHVLTTATQKYLDKALAAYEVDGWKADREDTVNHHRRKNGAATIIFRRWLEPDHA